MNTYRDVNLANLAFKHIQTYQAIYAKLCVNAASMLICTFIFWQNPMYIVIFFFPLIVASMYCIAQTDKPNHNIPFRLAFVALAIGLILCMPVGNHLAKKKIEADVAPIIAALAQLKAEQGVYPEQLPAEIALPVCPADEVPFYFMQKQEYSIFCSTIAMTIYSYDSERQSWRTIGGE